MAPKRQSRSGGDTQRTRHGVPAWDRGVWLLALAIAMGCGFRAWLAFEKRSIVPDEGISYLAATGHKADFIQTVRTKAFPYGQWAQTAEWRRFITVEHRYCFGRIASDLSQHDIHPPFYFWLLHVWCMLFGTALWTGPSLNVLVSGLAIVSLYGLVRDLSRNGTRAGLTALIWALSPTVIPIAYEARQYDTLALWTVLYVWVILRIGLPERTVTWRDFVWLSLATAFGLLTHYHFSLVVIGGVVVLLVKLIRKKRRRLVAAAAAHLAAAALFCLMNPHFLHAITRVKGQLQPLTTDELAYRLDAVMVRYSSFFLNLWLFGEPARAILKYSLIVALVIVVVWLAWATWSRLPATKVRSADAAIVVLFLWAAGTNILLYVSCLSPRHAMEPKHPAVVYPLFALVVGMIPFVLRSGRSLVATGLVLGFLFSATYETARFVQSERRRPLPLTAVEPSDAVIVDNTNTLFMPCVAIDVPAKAMMLLASKADLLGSAPEWARRMPERTYWISWVRNAEEAREATRLLRWLSRRFDVESLGQGTCLIQRR